jgi:hypothetical protein
MVFVVLTGFYIPLSLTLSRKGRGKVLFENIECFLLGCVIKRFVCCDS